jgi:hypothetical protein
VGSAARSGVSRRKVVAVDSSVVRAAARDAFKLTSVSTPGWADPRPDGQPPDERDYENCDDPGKFRILAARAEAWMKALTQTDLAEVEHLEAAPEQWRDLPEDFGQVIRTVRLRPRKPSSEPLLFGFGWLMGEPEARVVIGAGDPAVVVGITPQCACDACDLGSDILLEDFDSAILNVVTGQLVHITAERFVVHTSLHGGPVVSGELTGMTTSRFEEMFAEARAGKSEYPVVYGSRWW